MSTSGPTTSGEEAGHTPRGWVVAAAGLALFAAATLVVFDRWAALTPPVFDIRPESWSAHFLYHQHPHPDSDLQEHLPFRSPLFAWTDWFLDQYGRSYRSLLRSQAALLVLMGALFALIGARAGPAAAFTSGALALALPVHLLLASLPDDFLFNAVCCAAAVAMIIHSGGGRRRWLALPAGLAAGVAVRFAFVFSTGLVFGAACLAAVGAALCVDLWQAGWRPPVLSRGSGPSLFSRRYADVHLRAIAFAAGFFVVSGPWRFLTAYDWNYYATETMNPDHFAQGFSRALNAVFYPYVIGSHLVGPVGVALLAMGAVGLVVGRNRDRFTHGVWFLALPLALGWMLKKGAYYIIPGMSAAAAIAGIGLTSGPLRRVGPWVGPAAAIALASSSWLSLFTPASSIGIAEFRQLLGPDACYRLRLPDATASEAAHPAPGLVERMRRLRPGAQAREAHLIPARHYESRIRFYLTAEDADLLVLQPSNRIPSATNRPFLIFVKDRGEPVPASGADALRQASEVESIGLREGWAAEKTPFQRLLESLITRGVKPPKVYENREVVVWDLADALAAAP